MQSTLAGVRSLPTAKGFLQERQRRRFVAAADKHNRPAETKEGGNQLSVRDQGEESGGKKEAIRWSGGGVDLNITAKEREGEGG